MHQRQWVSAPPARVLCPCPCTAMGVISWCPISTGSALWRARAPCPWPRSLSLLGTLCTLRATEHTCSVRGVVQEEGEAWEWPKSVGGGEINRRGQMRTPAFVHPNSPSQQRSGRSLHQQPGCPPHTRQGTSSSPHWKKNIIRQWLITSWS